MFDVGFAELFLLGLVGLLVLGPERLPGVARTLGGLMRKARSQWATLRSTMEAELAEADVLKLIKETRDEVKHIGQEMKSDLPDVSFMMNPDSQTSETQQTDVDTDDGTDSENKIKAIDKPGEDQSSGSDH